MSESSMQHYRDQVVAVAVRQNVKPQVRENVRLSYTESGWPMVDCLECGFHWSVGRSPFPVANPILDAHRVQRTHACE